MSCKAKLNLTVCEGMSFRKTFIWKVGDPLVEVDLTDYSIRMHVRTSIPAVNIILDLSSEADAGIVIADQEEDTGMFSLELSPEMTRGLCPGGKTRELVYDLVMTDDDGTVRPLLYGKFTIEPAVTRQWGA